MNANSWREETQSFAGEVKIISVKCILSLQMADDEMFVDLELGHRCFRLSVYTLNVIVDSQHS